MPGVGTAIRKTVIGQRGVVQAPHKPRVPGMRCPVEDDRGYLVVDTRSFDGKDVAIVQEFTRECEPAYGLGHGDVPGDVGLFVEKR